MNTTIQIILQHLHDNNIYYTVSEHPNFEAIYIKTNVFIKGKDGQFELWIPNGQYINGNVLRAPIRYNLCDPNALGQLIADISDPPIDRLEKYGDLPTGLGMFKWNERHMIYGNHLRKHAR